MHVIGSLKYLIELLYNTQNDGKVQVFLDNALSLTSLASEEYFDLIVTDPPYYSDVPYTELSDFYYVWLKRILSDIGRGLEPRFIKSAFFDEWDNEIETQWRAFAKNEITLNEERFKYFGMLEKGKTAEELYRRMLARSFTIMADKLKDRGILITYFAHSDPDAWKALIYAGWKAARLRMTVAYPIRTESEESVVARGKSAITASIVVAWRKGVSGELDLAEEGSQITDAVIRKAMRYRRMGLYGTTLYVMLYATALSELTKAAVVKNGGKELTVDDIVKVAGRIALEALVKGVTYRAGPLEEHMELPQLKPLRIRTPEATLYLAFKMVGVPTGKRRRLPSSDLLLLGYGIMSLKEAEEARVIKAVRAEKGASVAKRKTYELLEPTDDTEDALLDLLGTKGVDLMKTSTMKTTADVLHVLEFHALKSKEAFQEIYDNLLLALGGMVEEAVEMAKAIVLEFGNTDPEARLCKRLLAHLNIHLPGVG